MAVIEECMFKSGKIAQAKSKNEWSITRLSDEKEVRGRQMEFMVNHLMGGETAEKAEERA